MATWGKTIGQIAEAGGVKGAGVVGSSIDALSDWRQSQEDKAITTHRWNIQNARDKWSMEAYIQDKQEQNALKTKLLTQTQNLKDATQQINDFFGQPYAPTREEVMKNVADLSAEYKGEILRMAELTNSTATAKKIWDLGGADSQTMYSDISKDTVREYGPQLLNAINQAKEDAISIASANMDLDSKSRQQYINAYANPYGQQYDREINLVQKAGQLPTMGDNEDALLSAQASNSAFGDSFQDWSDRVQKILKNKKGNYTDEGALPFTENLSTQEKG